MTTLLYTLFLMMPIAIGDSYTLVAGAMLHDSPQGQRIDISRPAIPRKVYIIGAEARFRNFSRWYHVKTPQGREGWVLAENLRNARTGLTPLAEEMKETSIIGTWIHGGTDVTYESHIVFSSNHTFVMKGWTKPHYQCRGQWIFNNHRKSLTLIFIDDRPYWSDMLTMPPIVNPRERYKILSVLPKQASVEFKLDVYEFDLVGFIFQKDLQKPPIQK